MAGVYLCCVSEYPSQWRMDFLPVFAWVKKPQSRQTDPTFTFSHPRNSASWDHPPGHRKALPISSSRSSSGLQSRLFTPWGLLPSPLLLAAHPDCLLVGLSVSALALFQSIPHTAAGAIFPECKPDHVTSLPVGLWLHVLSTVLSGKAQTLKLSEMVLHYSPCAFQSYYPLCINQLLGLLSGLYICHTSYHRTFAHAALATWNAPSPLSP